MVRFVVRAHAVRDDSLESNFELMIHSIRTRSQLTASASTELEKAEFASEPLSFARVAFALQT